MPAKIRRIGPKPLAVPEPDWEPADHIDLVNDEAAHRLWLSFPTIGREWEVHEMESKLWWKSTHGSAAAVLRLERYGLLEPVVAAAGHTIGWRMTDKGLAWIITTAVGALEAGFTRPRDIPEWLLPMVLRHAAAGL